jgi:hypothetical protein
VVIPGTAGLSLQHLTIAMWVKPARTLSEMGQEYPWLLRQNIPMAKSDRPADWKMKGFVFGALRSKGHLLGLRIGDGSQRLHDLNAEMGKPGTWSHWAVTFDGSRSAIYRDGVLVESQAMPGVRLQSELVDVDIGGGFEGDIDEIRLYRVALSRSGIQALLR